MIPVPFDVPKAPTAAIASAVFFNCPRLRASSHAPGKYAPQYGAFCGYAVSLGKLRPVDPMIFQIEDGRLILQHTQQAFDLFNKDLRENTGKADKNWPGLVKSHVGQPVQYDKPAQAPTASAR